jgi:hypothetical protein
MVIYMVVDGVGMTYGVYNTPEKAEVVKEVLLRLHLRAEIVQMEVE